MECNCNKEDLENFRKDQELKLMYDGKEPFIIDLAKIPDNFNVDEFIEEFKKWNKETQSKYIFNGK